MEITKEISKELGVDLSEKNIDFSAATIAKVENGIFKIIDSKISNNSEIIKEFVKKYEPEYFTVKYELNKLLNKLKYL